MRTLFVTTAALVVLFAGGAIVSAAPPAAKNFGTHLSGDQEVPARETPAQGQAILKAARDGTSIDYKLIVANIENVVAAHIHCASAGVNGPVGVTLFMGGVPGSGVVNGILAQGEITAPDAGNACGWETVDDVLEAMMDGATYINVHTNDGIAPTNTGPGDFPGGEIRGQIGANGPS